MLLALHLALLSPQKETLQRQHKLLAKKTTEFNSAKTAASRQDRDALFKQLKETREQTHQFIADSNDLDNLKFSISRIAIELDVKAFTSKGTGNQLYSEIPNCDYIARSRLFVSFRCSFNKLALFINALERHKPVVFIDEFSISESGRTDLEHVVNILLKIFIRKPTEVLDSG